MKELDDKDRAILSILSRDAKIPIKTLAGEIGLSRSATSERILFLEKSGVIRGYRADIGQLNEGLICAFLLISLVRTPSLGVLDRLAAYPEVRRVSSVSGQLDLIVEIEVPSINHLNTIRDRVATMDQVDDVTTSIILRRDIDRGDASLTL
ncbi:transcriptional regulator, AsnC family [Phyllobacterium sp. YR620]|uniref:Lrp/AsnC family transcriptional regulator n=1 Tax=Phyllobacterium sp. YR620 TaxID=1881066 RepID=UPI000880B2FA|nr:Lrp/AsnC family transcriptional regulator [Phyllobacterium sp. YR620]SDP91371.1 transcriptional regulator, AsnC family [Phyllobacterium sp. YR620]